MDFPEYSLIMTTPRNEIWQEYQTLQELWKNWCQDVTKKMEDVQRQLTEISYQIHFLEIHYDKDVDKLSQETNALLEQCRQMIRESDKEEWEHHVSLLDSCDFELEKKFKKPKTLAIVYKPPTKQWGDDDDEDDW
jgi:hypothetical protein